jgi:hypothetical protein
MQVHQAQPGGWAATLIPLVIIVVVMALRMRRMGRVRPLRIEQLWIVPALYLVVVVLLFAQNPPSLGGWLCAFVALVAGGLLGWQRGRMMRIHVDPETHALGQQASMAGMIFLIVLIAVRYAARDMGGAMHMNIALMTDTLAALALGMFSIQRLEMYLRAKRMLAEAQV